MTKVINFFGGPGAGKSTLAAETFGWMKRLRMNVEYVPEFAKDLTWKKSLCIDDQVYILGNQHHALYTLLGQVDYIITDSPLILTSHYVHQSMVKFGEEVDAFTIRSEIATLALRLFHMYDNLNFFVERGDREFVQAGRNQNEQEAKQIDGQVHQMLKDFELKFEHVSSLAMVERRVRGR